MKYVPHSYESPPPPRATSITEISGEVFGPISVGPLRMGTYLLNRKIAIKKGLGANPHVSAVYSAGGNRQLV